MPSRNGSILYNSDGVDQESCLIVEKLINAGAIIVGRTTMPEYFTFFYFNIHNILKEIEKMIILIHSFY